MISHINKKNKPQLVNVLNKKNSLRSAKAVGEVCFSKKTFNKINSLKNKKGEIINTAIIAGISGAKKTSDLIPLCHNILLEDIKLDIKPINKDNLLYITCLVQSYGKTGVEMEALTGVTIASLTIYDMCKALDKKILIKEVKLVEKKGGKSDFIKK